MASRDDWPDKCRELATTIRAHCLHMTHNGKGGHIGSMLSMAELVAVLYDRILKVDPKNPDWPERDRFLCSKGHGGAAVYAALAEKGFFPKDWMESYYRDAGKLMGHISHKVPGVEFSTGSLGHGLPVATGMALSAKVHNQGHRVFCLLSDGDMDEGSTYEATMFAAQQKLDNLVAVYDYNKIQALGFTKDVIDLEPLAERLTACRWAVREVDGHNVEEIDEALGQVPFEKGKPSWLVAHTVKGKGVSFYENTVSCHYGSPSEEQVALALKELGVSS
jgi:transketolase